MEKAQEYQVSTYCNFGDCVGVSKDIIVDEQGKELLQIVNTTNPEEVAATISREWFARHIIAIQEELLTATELLERARYSQTEEKGFLEKFTDEEVVAFHHAARMGEFDAVADVEGFTDRIPEGVSVERYLNVVPLKAPTGGGIPESLYFEVNPALTRMLMSGVEQSVA